MASGEGPASRPDLLAAVLDSLPAHTAVVDPAGRIVAVSRSWRRFGLDNGGDESGCGVGADYLAVCGQASGAERDEARDVADGIRRAVLGEVEQFSMDYECSSPQEERWFQVTVVPVRASRDGGRLGALVTHTNITARKLDELELVHAATHDPLTGLLNRALLLVELGRELHRAHTERVPVALLYLDLDGFKTVNDALGHDAGDQLLRATADRLRSALRPGQHLARMGGDEFVALLPRTGVNGARRCARRMAQVVREPLELDGFPVVVLGSIGIAVSDATSTVAEDLLSGADAAMYRAKRRGRARTEVFAGQLRARAHRRARVEAQLEASLDDGSLQLFRQPVVSLVDGTEVGSEALARWFPAAGDIRPAAAFLEEVTHSRVRRDVTDAILLCALTAMAREDRVVGVNVSLPDLRGASLVQEVGDVLRRTGCPPDRLVLEMGEDLVCQAGPLVRRTLAGLHAMGVRLVIDHVSGQVPAATLAALPLQGIKLDREMVAPDQGEGHPSESRQAVLRSLVSLTGALGLELSAVGVETRDQQRWLVADGVTRGQGWRLGPPAPWVTVRRHRGPEDVSEAATRRFAVAPIPD